MRAIQGDTVSKERKGERKEEEGRLVGAGEVAQWVEAPATKPVKRVPFMEPTSQKKRTHPSKPTFDLYMCTCSPRTK